MHSYRADIDGLRAVAVLAVVAFHAGWISGGFVGVDVFFVISGYLISGIIFREAGKPGFIGRFYAGRIRRIFPALIVVLSACMIAGWFVLLPDELKALGKHVFSGAAFVSNVALAREADYFDVAADLKPLVHLWSLGIEEQFYFVWPALIILARWRKWNISLVIGGILIVSLTLDIALIGSRPVTVFYSPFTRLWELLIGAALARFEMTRRLPYSVAASFAGLALVVSAIFLFDRTMPYPGWRAIVPVVGSALLIAASASAPINRYLLSLRPFVCVGLISYPLYLWHWPLLSFVRIVESGDADPKFILAAVALSFPLAWLTYKLVEQPIRRPSGLPWKVAGLSSAMTAAAALGMFLFVNGGPERAPVYASVAASSDPWWEGVKVSCDGLIESITKNDSCIVSIVQDAGPIDLIVGDSHSFAFASGLINSGIGARNMYVISLAGCPPFLSVERYENGIKRNCDLEPIIAKAKRGREINSLFLVGRYAFYATGDGYGSDGGLKPGTVAIARHGNSSEDFAAVLAEGLETTLLAVKARRTTLVLQAPELGFDIKSCEETRPVRLSSHIRTPCGVLRHDVDERQSTYRPAFLSVLKRFPDVNIIDPMKSLCDQNYCYGLRGKRALYADDNHVSSIGAALVFSSVRR